MLLAGSKDKIVQTLPASCKANADRYMRAALLAYNKDANLQKCTHLSIMMSVYRACQIGLEVNTEQGHAYLIPYNGECTLQVGYKGVVELAYRTGRYAKIEARCVYQGDEFEHYFNPDLVFHHRPCGVNDDAKLMAVYAVAKTHGGETIIEVMSKAEVDKVRNVSRAKNSGPWVQWYGEKAKGVVLKRMLKRQPQSPELTQAIAMDNEDYDLDQQPSQPKLKGPAAVVARVQAMNAPTPPPAQDEPEHNPADPNGLVEDADVFEEGRE